MSRVCLRREGEGSPGKAVRAGYEPHFHSPIVPLLYATLAGIVHTSYSLVRYCRLPLPSFHVTSSPLLS